MRVFLITAFEFDYNLPKVDSKKVSKYSHELGQAIGKGLGQTVAEFLKPRKQKSAVSTLQKKEEEFIQASFAGKNVAIPFGSLNSVRTVKLQKVSFNTNALMAAIINNKIMTGIYLLEHNADPNIQNDDGITALHIAARLGQKKMVKKLLKFNANPNIQDKNGMTPLMYAVMKNKNNDHLSMIQYLVDHGTNVNLQNKKGETVLFIAVAHDDYDTSGYLLEHFADPFIKDNHKKTIFDIVRSNQLKQLLQNYQFLLVPTEHASKKGNIPIFGLPLVEE